MLKRYLVFLVLAAGLIALNVGLPILFPGLRQQPVAQPEPAKKADPADPAAKQGDAEQKPPAGGEKEKAPADKTEPGSGEKAPADSSQAKDPADETKTPAEEAQPPQPAAGIPESWVALGSVDPTDQNPYRMLVTLTSRGAAVHRVELSSPRYLDLDDRSGYLGHLVTKTADSGEGLLVQVVGPGTPAAEAGLQRNDVLLKIDNETLKHTEQLRVALAGKKPRETAELTVLRDGKSLQLTATLRRLPLAVMRPEIENLRIRNTAPPDGFEDPASLLLTLSKLNEAERKEEQLEIPGLDLLHGNWELISPTPAELSKPGVIHREAAFQRNLIGGITLIKRYRLAETPAAENANSDYPSYHLEFEVEVQNTTDKPQEVAYQLDGPTGLPIEGWWYGAKIARSGAVGVRDMFGQWFEKPPVMFGAATIAGDTQDTITDQSLMFTGIDAQYFSAILIPQKKQAQDLWFAKVRALRIGPVAAESADLPLTNITVRMFSMPIKLPPKGQVKQAFKLFAGPKKPAVLEQYTQPADEAYTLSELIYYGWPIWGAVARVMTGILHGFYSVFQNYGIAIILLTVVVRGCMFPLSRKQALNMVKMQELKPEMDRIQQKYKTEMDKRSKAMQELFRKNNYNPMGGCLLMLLQLPIFLGLYRALMIDVELRQAPLFSDAIRWCSNLAGPDMLFDWSAWMPESVTRGQGFLGLGPYFNILPVITVGLFLFQQKMFMPPATDETSAMQQKMMKYMMLFMGFMFYKVASGLCLYFIASTLWGMAERKFLPKANTAGVTPATAEGTPESKPGENGSKKTNSSKEKKRR